ncbi:hypothetical protein ACH5AJ_35310 [Streptomyces rochei]|uniref:hypothetical protein n=1 Tax=Streptomyces rochei TaxID=1928 RepID=UPI0037A2FFAD
MPRNRNNRPARVTDLSHEVPAASADENNHARTRATAGFHAELERTHRRINQLERELERERNRSVTRDNILREHLRRRTAALWTAFMTLGAHAGYGMSTSGWGEPQWWFHAGAMAGLVGGVGYLITPNIRRILHLSSETADPELRR